MLSYLSDPWCIVAKSLSCSGFWLYMCDGIWDNVFIQVSQSLDNIKLAIIIVIMCIFCSCILCLILYTICSLLLFLLVINLSSSCFLDCWSIFLHDRMWREIRLLAASKPLVASMSDVAASGGYYMAMGCETIIAEKLTLTGSIGVVTGKFISLHKRKNHSEGEFFLLFFISKSTWWFILNLYSKFQILFLFPESLVVKDKW